MKVYISGPMTGYPGLNFGAFAQAEKDLTAEGHEVVNPARHGKPGGEVSYEDLLRNSLRDVLDCEAICLLPSWELSRGATIEWQVAMALGMTVLHHPGKATA